MAAYDLKDFPDSGYQPAFGNPKQVTKPKYEGFKHMALSYNPFPKLQEVAISHNFKVLNWKL